MIAFQWSPLVAIFCQTVKSTASSISILHRNCLCLPLELQGRSFCYLYTLSRTPQSEINFVTNLLSLRSSVLHSKLRFKATLEKHFYPGGIQLSYTDVFSVKCLKNNPNMEITNNYHQDAANHICRRQCDGIGLYLTLQRSMKT